MNRRSFLGLLAAAPVAVAAAKFDAHRVYFDMGRKLWVPQRDYYTIDWPYPGLLPAAPVASYSVTYSVSGYEDEAVNGQYKIEEIDGTAKLIKCSYAPRSFKYNPSGCNIPWRPRE